MGIIYLAVIILLLIGALPRWGHSRNWGYYPSGGLGIAVILVMLLLMTGYLPRGF